MLLSSLGVCNGRERHNEDVPGPNTSASNWHTTSTSILELMCMRLSGRDFEEAKARAVTWITAWDSQGPHRTGTAGDEAGARWLAHEAAALGVEATSEVFKLDRLEPVACYLELDGERIPGVPAFDAPGTGADGVTGALSLSEHDEAILVMRLSPRSVYTGEYKRLRRDCASRLVIACSGGTSGMGLLPRRGKIPHVGRQQSAVPSAGRPLAA